MERNKCQYCGRKLFVTGHTMYANVYEDCHCGGKEAEIKQHNDAWARAEKTMPRAIGDTKTGFRCSCCGKSLNWHYFGGVAPCTECNAKWREANKEDLHICATTRMS